MKVIKQFFPISIILFYIVMELLGIDIWFTENINIRVFLLPIMILFIYFSINDLNKNDDVSFSRWRWIGFDFVIILLSGFSAVETIFKVIKLIVL